MSGATRLRARSCGVAVAACAVALLVKLVLGPVMVPSVFLTFYAAVLCSAWWGGMQGGLLAAALSIALAVQLFLPPIFPMAASDPTAALRVALFAIIAAGLSAATATLRRARDELELRVNERTAELSRTNVLLEAQIAAGQRAEAALRETRDELEVRVAQRTAELSGANQQLREQAEQRRHVDEALRQREELLRALMDNATAIIYLLDVDRRLLQVNRRWEAVTKISRQQALGKTAHDLFPQEIAASFTQNVASVFSAGEPSQVEEVFFQGGEPQTYVSMHFPLFNSDGTLFAVGGISTDITDRKRAEERLEDLNQRIQSLLEGITDGFCALDHHGRFTYVNPSAEVILNRRRADLLGKNIWAAFPEAVDSGFYTLYQRSMAERVSLDAEAYYPPMNRWFKVRSYPSQDGLSLLFEDITERHGREVTTLSDILHALNAHLDVQSAFPAVADGLRTLSDCDRSSLTWFDEDRQWATVLALDHERADVQPGSRLRMADIPATPNILAGRPHVVPDLSAEIASPIVQQIYEDGMRSALNLPLQGTDQILGMLTLTWSRVNRSTAVALPLLSQIAAAVALALEKSRLFEEVRAGRERLGALSHRLLEVQEAERRRIARELHDEIGQDLTGLKLMLDAVERLPIEAARNRIGELHTLVNDLLARVRDLSLDLRPGMLDDLGLLPALLWLFGRYSSQTNVRVAFEHSGLDRRFSTEIETAAYRIVQEALTNVARHARTPEVTVRAWADSAMVSVQVKDAGNGFVANGALLGSTTSGLTGMRERAVLLGGRLTIDSTVGKGTCLSAELPLNGTMETLTDEHPHPVG